MKKIFLALLICCSASLFANSFKPQLHISPSVRQEGYGGFYSTDVYNFYGIYANPAMLGTRKNHTLIPGLGVTLSGPLQDLPKFYSALTKNDVVQLGEILKKNGGLRLGSNIQPLLAMGHTTDFGFGWGVCSNIFVNASIPNLTLSDINVGFETIFTGGFGFPVINTDNHLLSLGFTAKGFFQVSSMFNEGIISVASKVKSMDIKNLPAYVTLGLGLDLGIYYSLCNSFDFALVYHDPWSPAWVSESTFSNIFKMTFNKMKTLDSRISAGFCYRAHTEATRGAISSLRFMVEYKDFFTPFKKLGRNPWLELSGGAEIVFDEIVSLRVGLNDLYPACGVGFAFGQFKIDMSIYGKELGLEPGSCPCLNAGLFIGVTY